MVFDTLKMLQWGDDSYFLLTREKIMLISFHHMPIKTHTTENIIDNFSLFSTCHILTNLLIFQNLHHRIVSELFLKIPNLEKNCTKRQITVTFSKRMWFTQIITRILSPLFWLKIVPENSMEVKSTIRKLNRTPTYSLLSPG